MGPLRGKIRYATLTAEINPAGLDARREDGSSHLVLWDEVRAGARSTSQRQQGKQRNRAEPCPQTIEKLSGRFGETVIEARSPITRLDGAGAHELRP